MKKTLEIKPSAGGTVTFTDLERFVTEARAQGAGELGTTVKATVRFNGTLRSLSVEMEDARSTTGQTTMRDVPGAGVVPITEAQMIAEDDAWLARQW